MEKVPRTEHHVRTGNNHLHGMHEQHTSSIEGAEELNCRIARLIALRNSGLTSPEITT